jgi:hypothetical protein
MRDPTGYICPEHFSGARHSALLKFAPDSVLEGDGFEPSVPGARETVILRKVNCAGIDRAAKNLAGDRGFESISLAAVNFNKNDYLRGRYVLAITPEVTPRCSVLFPMENLLTSLVARRPRLGHQGTIDDRRPHRGSLITFLIASDNRSRPA